MMNAQGEQEHVVKKSKFTEEQIAFALKFILGAVHLSLTGNISVWAIAKKH